ncbi:MAG: phosphatidylcholine/phosphatidylserine synthase [Planctomycetes bacterium]|nr:phosphatidylcholine/phosphatidylserine synthase [Planctomycetota bacterium]
MGAAENQQVDQPGPESGASGRILRLEPGAPSTSGNTGRMRRRRRMPGLALLPSALTLGNAVCGLAALMELMHGFAAAAAGRGDEVALRLGYAAMLVGGGMLFDAMDGKVARMTATTGRFGAELDSLCDALTFGVTPALMIRVGGGFFFASEAYDSKILWAVASLYACCAILRLARFNVETGEDDDHTTFSGLPSPAAAATICAMFLGLTWMRENVADMDGVFWRWVLRVLIPGVGALVGLMMVTRIRYVHVFNRFVSRKQSLRTLVVILLVGAVVVIFADHWRLLVTIAMLGYFLSGPIYYLYRIMRGRGLLGRRMAVAERIRLREERNRKAATKD